MAAAAAANRFYLGAYHSAAELEKYMRGVRVKQPFYALVARSNAGKSSLINALLGTNSAHVSQTPGKTQAAQLFQGPGFLLIDLPGYGWARAGDRQDMDRILLECLGLKYDYSTSKRSPNDPEKRQRLQILRLVDANRALNFPKFVEKDAKLLDFLQTNKLAYTNIITKTDAITRSELQRLKLLLLPREEYPFFVSSRTREGMEEVKAMLAKGARV